MADPDWLPSLLLLHDYGNKWDRYIEEAYAVFHNDFICSQPKFDGCWVRHRRDPISQGKEAGFWHCVSTGPSDSERIPEMRRIERIRWVCAIIKNCDKPEVQVWTRRHGSEARPHLWFREEFLVVLGERIRQRDGFRYYQLITAFDTLREHQKGKRRKEMEYWTPKNG